MKFSKKCDRKRIGELQSDRHALQSAPQALEAIPDEKLQEAPVETMVSVVVPKEINFSISIEFRLQISKFIFIGVKNKSLSSNLPKLKHDFYDQDNMNKVIEILSWGRVTEL